MTDTSRGESWIKEKEVETRQDAEIFLQGKGEQPNSPFWRQVLDNIYLEESKEEPTSGESSPIDDILPEDEKVDSEGNVLGRFIRRILRGIQQ